MNKHAMSNLRWTRAQPRNEILHHRCRRRTWSSLPCAHIPGECERSITYGPVVPSRIACSKYEGRLTPGQKQRHTTRMRFVHTKPIRLHRQRSKGGRISWELLVVAIERFNRTRKFSLSNSFHNESMLDENWV